MKITLEVGNIVEQQADIIFCSANTMLNMSGGVGAAILATKDGQKIQEELYSFLKAEGKNYVREGSVVKTSPGSLLAKHLLHIVAINAFYESSTELITRALQNALEESERLEAKVIATPLLATGYGRLPLANFAEALKNIYKYHYSHIALFKVIVRSEDEQRELKNYLGEEKWISENYQT